VHDGPQLATLFGLHVPPQALYPSLHATPHVAAEHAATPFGVAGHALAHEPQCIGSVVTSTHEPLQAVSPFPQEVAHVPLVHTRSSAHAFPHPPQCSWLVAVLVSHPSETAALQSARFAWQEPTAQAPPTHAAVPLAIEQGVHASASHP
jgi:hypothetical protein